MDSFEVRRLNYYKRLKRDPKLIVAVAEQNEKKAVDIMLLPRNDKELTLAETILTVIEDSLSIVKNASKKEAKAINLDDSIIVNLYSDIIRSLKDNDMAREDLLKQYINEDTSVEDVAKFMYESLVVFSVDADKTCDCIYRKSGFNDKDILSLIQFDILFNKANNIVNEIKNYNSNGFMNAEFCDLTNEDLIKKVVDFSNEFHKLYLKGNGEDYSLKLETDK